MKPKYIIEIIDEEENYFLSGALYSINDSSLVITCSSCEAGEFNSFLVPVPIERIGILKIQSKNVISLSNVFFSGGILLGGLPASQLAYLLIHKSVDNAFREKMENSIDPVGSLLRLSLLGAAPATILGLFTQYFYKQKIILNKNTKLFAENKSIIMKYCYIQ